jgi:hypothetical protein
MGGLGNQLFQIFVTISLSLKYKIPFIFEYSDILRIGHHRPTYWNNFLLSLKKFTTLNKLNYPVYREPSYNYQEIILSNYLGHIKQSGLKLTGYFQSYKYFKDEYSSIIKFIKLSETQEVIKKKYNNYFENKKNVISLHFRLGDYKHIQECHPILNDEYYIKSLNHMVENISDKNITILYFCEKEDNELVSKRMNNIIKNVTHNKIIDVIKVNDNIEDWEQLVIMSCCHYNIIANSSFSWWGAYFNDYKDKIVCYPSIWCGKNNKENINDLCPDNWIKIN